LVKDRTERLIYHGWEPLFRTVKPYHHVSETLSAFKSAGLNLGLLSDFPAEQKLKYLGLDGYWDTVICSEHTNRLKPDPTPFQELARRMALPPEQILYVGNSVSYDIVGAKQQGMKAALVSSPLKKHRRNTGNADFVFSDYRQLRAFVLS
jgi:putative hydrolase of the HAD superfamily